MTATEVRAMLEQQPKLEEWTMRSGCTDYACQCHEQMTALANEVLRLMEENEAAHAECMRLIDHDVRDLRVRAKAAETERDQLSQQLLAAVNQRDQYKGQCDQIRQQIAKAQAGAAAMRPHAIRALEFDIELARYGHPPGMEEECRRMLDEIKASAAGQPILDRIKELDEQIDEWAKFKLWLHDRTKCGGNAYECVEELEATVERLRGLLFHAANLLQSGPVHDAIRAELTGQRGEEKGLQGCR